MLYALLNNATRCFALVFAYLMILTGGGLAAHAASRDAEPPLYRIAVRVHLSQSTLSDDEVMASLTDVNVIWREQAAICFEFEMVMHNQPLEHGLNVFFAPEVARGWNGYYFGDDRILVRDIPRLRVAPHPSRTDGGRVIAHEIGHALGLRQNEHSDDFLMCSGSQGFHLMPHEIDTARDAASLLMLPNTAPLNCNPPVFSH